MKSFIIALVIFISLTSVLTFYNIYLNHTFSEYSDRISLIEKAICDENYVSAKISTLLLNRKLTKDSGLLYVITERGSIDDAITECSKLLRFIDVFDKSEAYATASGIKSILQKANEKSCIFP